MEIWDDSRLELGRGGYTLKGLRVKDSKTLIISDHTGRFKL